MPHKSLPAAVSSFLDGLRGNSTASLERGLALSVVGLTSDGRYRGADGIRSMLESNAAFHDRATWSVVYAMDSEVVLRSADGTVVQLVLDCGRIAFVRVTEPARDAAFAA